MFYQKSFILSPLFLIPRAWSLMPCASSLMPGPSCLMPCFYKGKIFSSLLKILQKVATFALPFLSVAQLVEQLTLNQWVAGSSPAGETGMTRVSEFKN
jgi:hypothetical protein